MTSHQTAIFNLSTDMDQLMTLEFTTSEHVGARNPSKWISPVGFRGSACVFSREHPLAMNYISDDKSSLLSRLDPDGDLYRVLADWEAKVNHANAPHTATTNELVNYPEPGSSYPRRSSSRRRTRPGSTRRAIPSPRSRPSRSGARCSPT